MRGKLLVILVLIVGCSKQKDFDLVEVYGHAGMGLNILNSVYHDNSKEAVEMALGIEGCNGVEVDVHLSADGELWLYHDISLETETNGEGCIPNLTADQLKDLHYKTANAEQLVRLSELDTTFLNGKTIFLDLRHYDECDLEFVDENILMSRLAEIGYADATSFKVCCILGNPAWISSFLTAGFHVAYSIYSYQEYVSFSTSYPGIEGYVIRNSDISKEEVAQIRADNKKVIIFEVRSPKGIRNALHKLPDGLITDDVRATLIEKY